MEGAMRTYRSFLSCSFDKKDEEVVNNFVRIIKGLGIEPEIYNYPELGRLPARIKEHISRSDCLIAIATKRKKLEEVRFMGMSRLDPERNDPCLRL